MDTEFEQKLDLLDKIPFFDLFDVIEKNALTRESTCFQTYHTNEAIIQSGGKDNSLFVLLKGSVLVTKGPHKEVMLAQLDAGDFFGELSLLLRKPRSTTIIAKSNVIAWGIDARSLKSLELGIQNKIQFKIVQLTVKRLDEMNKKYIKVVQEKTSAEA